MKKKNITQFDSTNIKTMRSTIQNALHDALAEVGLTVQVKGIKYDKTYFTLCAKVETQNSGEQLFKEGAESYGLKPEWFGQPFIYQHHLYRIVGWNSNSRRFKVATLRLNDNRPFGFTPDLVKQAYGAKKVGKAA